jgi:hypothetical protein
MPLLQLDPRWAESSSAPRTAGSTAESRRVPAVRTAPVSPAPLPGFSTSQGKAAMPLVDFLIAVRPKAEALLRGFGLTTAELEEILASTLQVLAWRWETVRDRETWLLAMLERRCKLLIEARVKVVPE